MWLLLIAMVLTIMIYATTCDGQAVRRCVDRSFACEVWGHCDHSCTRVIPTDNSYYNVPRSVGVNSMVPDTGVSGAAWWSITPSQPFWQTLDWIYNDYQIDAVGTYLRSHPWDHTQNDENIRDAFRHPDARVLHLNLQYWGAQANNCNADGEIVEGGVNWLHYPTDEGPWPDIIAEGDPNRAAILERHRSVYDALYDYYSGQDKHIFINSPEAGWQLFGEGCRSRELCDLPPRHWCRAACAAGTLVRDPATPEGASCDVACCDVWRRARASYMLRTWTERQAAAEKARADNPGAALKVWHSVEVVFYGTEDWQFIVPLCDIIPQMPSPPDFIGMSIYPMAGDPVGALEYAMECTGLPASRFYISEVGRKVDKGDQYEWIYSVVDALFQKGVAFALVWAIHSPISYEPNWPYSVVDPRTGEWRPGMYAIRDLNEKWRRP